MELKYMNEEEYRDIKNKVHLQILGALQPKTRKQKVYGIKVLQTGQFINVRNGKGHWNQPNHAKAAFRNSYEYLFINLAKKEVTNLGIDPSYTEIIDLSERLYQEFIRNELSFEEIT